jgi:outer membrane lipoprotein-sorting protein
MPKYQQITGFLIAISLCMAAYAQSPAFDPDAQQIMRRVRENHANAGAWFVDHRISIEETEGKASPVMLLDVTFITGNHATPGKPGGIAASSFCAERCRIETRIAGGLRTLLVRDGTTTWLYSGQSGTYMKGSTLREVSTSVSGSMMLASHVVPLERIVEEEWSELRKLADDSVVVSGEKRSTYVLEATLKNNGLSLDEIASRSASPSPDTSLFSTPSGLLQLFQLQGLTGQRTPLVSYFAATGAPPAKVRFWIDKERYFIWRRSSVQTAAKLVITPELTQTQPTSPPNALVIPPTSEVTMRVDDQFSRVSFGDAVPDAVFTFQAPEGAREIPNIRQGAPVSPGPVNPASVPK